MLVGHYGASLLVRLVDRRLSLGLIFVAAQWLDLVWASLMLAGVERMRIVPGFTASNPFDFYFMPFSHSLESAMLWAGVAFLLCRFGLRISTWQSALLASVAAAHWGLDWVVHVSDLPLAFAGPKVGLGWWNHPALGLTLEAALLVAGVAVYLRQTVARSVVGRVGIVVLAVVMVAIQGLIFFGPVFPSTAALTGLALFGYVFYAVVAWRLDGQRRLRSGQGAPE